MRDKNLEIPAFFLYTNRPIFQGRLHAIKTWSILKCCNFLVFRPYQLTTFLCRQEPNYACSLLEFKRINWLNANFLRGYILDRILYSETLNKEYIERIHQMSYSSLSDNGMLQIFSFLIK